jgi:hypothetical protein
MTDFRKPNPKRPIRQELIPGGEFLLDETARTEGDWGPWLLAADTGTLIKPGKLGTEEYDYEVDLHGCVNSAETLDWIMQIAAKDWGHQTTSGLVNAIMDILDPQRNLCSWGVDRRLTRAEIQQAIDAAAARYPKAD